jgi:expansin (peptidoglycan-binding protein)
MTPILIFFFDVSSPIMAVGTDLLFAAFTKLGGTVKMARSGLVDWRVVAAPVSGQRSRRADHPVGAQNHGAGRPWRSSTS